MDAQALHKCLPCQSQCVDFAILQIQAVDILKFNIYITRLQKASGQEVNYITAYILNMHASMTARVKMSLHDCCSAGKCVRQLEECQVGLTAAVCDATQLIISVSSGV